MITTFGHRMDVMHKKVVLILRHLVKITINVLMTGVVLRPDVITLNILAMTIMHALMMIVTLTKDAHILL
jgi:hypothetical protein